MLPVCQASFEEFIPYMILLPVLWVSTISHILVARKLRLTQRSKCESWYLDTGLANSCTSILHSLLRSMSLTIKLSGVSVLALLSPLRLNYILLLLNMSYALYFLGTIIRKIIEKYKQMNVDASTLCLLLHQ